MLLLAHVGLSGHHHVSCPAAGMNVRPSAPGMIRLLLLRVTSEATGLLLLLLLRVASASPGVDAARVVSRRGRVRGLLRRVVRLLLLVGGGRGVVAGRLLDGNGPAGIVLAVVVVAHGEGLTWEVTVLVLLCASGCNLALLLIDETHGCDAAILSLSLSLSLTTSPPSLPLFGVGFIFVLR